MKAIFIIPYFGKLPSYFNAWLKSAEANPCFTFRFYTDNLVENKLPPNIEFKYTSFEDFKNTIQKKIPEFKDCSISKICDYKPTWGYVFEETIKEYDWWGYCDIDLVLGDLSIFIKDSDTTGYEKLFAHGHMTLIRNTEINNRVFMKSLNDESYKEVFSNPEVCIFDEMSNGININKLFYAFSSGYYTDYSISDINPYSYSFRCARYDYKDAGEPHDITYGNGEKVVFLWDDGKLFKISALNNKLSYQEQRYVHFQKRPMVADESVLGCKRFVIVPNRIFPYDGIIDVSFVTSHAKNKVFYLHAIKLKFKNIKKRISNSFSMDKR